MPPLSNLLRLPLEEQARIDEMLAQGKPCAVIAAKLREQDVDTSAAAVGRYRKNIWLPKVEKQRDMLALLEIADPADPAKSLGRVNIALAQTVLKDNLELLALDEHITPEDAIPLALKALTAQEKASKAVNTEIQSAIKAHTLDEIRKANEDDLFVKKNGRLVRVELVEPGAGNAPRLDSKKGGKTEKAIAAVSGTQKKDA